MYQEPSRRRQNRIGTLLNSDGEVCETKEEMNGIVQNFYTGLYSAPEQIDVNAVLNSVPVKVTREMNEQLCRQALL
jgi:hypothetical protein